MGRKLTLARLRTLIVSDAKLRGDILDADQFAPIAQIDAGTTALSLWALCFGKSSAAISCRRNCRATGGAHPDRGGRQRQDIGTCGAAQPDHQG